MVAAVLQLVLTDLCQINDFPQRKGWLKDVFQGWFFYGVFFFCFLGEKM